MHAAFASPAPLSLVHTNVSGVVLRRSTSARRLSLGSRSRCMVFASSSEKPERSTSLGTTKNDTGNEELSAAEQTRRALSASEPMVKFRREVDSRTESDAKFSYTSGVGAGGIDVWLISTILFFLVPVVVFAIGVSAGYIDVSPR